jgi:hypothetical protein
MTISLKRPITRLKKTDAIMIREAIPIFLYIDLDMNLVCLIKKSPGRQKVFHAVQGNPSKLIINQLNETVL